MEHLMTRIIKVKYTLQLMHAAREISYMVFLSKNINIKRENCEASLHHEIHIYKPLLGKTDTQIKV